MRFILTLTAIFSMLFVSVTAQSDGTMNLYNVDSTTVKTNTAKNSWWQEKSDHSTKFRPKQLIAPAALFAVGALGIGKNAPLDKISMYVRDKVGYVRGDNYMSFDDYMQYVPTAMFLGLSALPTKSKHTFSEKVCIGAVTFIAEVALVNGLKYTIKKQRPNFAERNSFPSGHTATAFAGAELVRIEYGWDYGIPAYIFATGVGFMRIYNDRHWLTDTLGGAAIGIISARIGYWLLPLNRKIFNLKSSSAIALTPIYYSEFQAIGASCTICF